MAFLTLSFTPEALLFLQNHQILKWIIFIQVFDSKTLVNLLSLFLLFEAGSWTIFDSICKSRKIVVAGEAKRRYIL
jgi:hypothetical protein